MRVSETVARRLLDAIRWMADRPEECARSPGRDFTRVRSLGLNFNRPRRRGNRRRGAPGLA